MKVFGKRNENGRRRPRLHSLVGLAALALVATACGSSGDDQVAPASGKPAAQAPYALSFGDISGGTGDITWAYIEKNALQAKYGLALERRETSAIPTLYSDFAANRYPVTIGSPDAFAAQAAKGLPVRMLSVNGKDAVFLLAKKDLKVPQDLAGATIAGATAAGSFKTLAAVLADTTGLDIQKQSKIVPAQNNMQAITQVIAGSADAAVAWEADVSTALAKYPELKVIYSNVAQFEGKFGVPSFTTSYAYRTDSNIPQDKLQAFFELYREAQTKLQEDPQMADKLAQEVLKSAPGVYASAFESDRLAFAPALVKGKVAEALKKQILVSQNYGIVPTSVPDSFYGTD
ncbi:MAG: Twin-arginine translocation pathway signal [Frankiales bacterium]|jgi:ABC-type amino acid transport substrate-binding protein|nr:Twin-arginine translocation pathway signal [Frankiales bacterium]